MGLCCSQSQVEETFDRLEGLGRHAPVDLTPSQSIPPPREDPDRERKEQMEKMENFNRFKDKVIEKGFDFPACLKWSLPITMFLDQKGDEYMYTGLFQYGNCQVVMSIPVDYDAELPDLGEGRYRMYPLKSHLNVDVFVDLESDPSVTARFPLSMCHETIDLGMLVLNDRVLNTHHGVFIDLGRSDPGPELDGLMMPKDPDFPRFVTAVETWIKWAVNYDNMNDGVDAEVSAPQ